MKRTETLFLCAVLVFALLICARSLSELGPLFLGGVDVGRQSAGVAGKSRTVDANRIMELIRQKALSDREALFYKPVPSTAPGTVGGSTGEGSASRTPEGAN